MKISNHLYNAIIFYLTFLIAACTKTEHLPSPSPSLIGTWKLTEAKVTSCQEPSNNKDELCTDDCGFIGLSSTVVTFMYGDGSTRLRGTYTVSKDMIYFTFTGSPVSSYQYTLTDNFLTLVSQGPFGCVLTATYSKQ